MERWTASMAPITWSKVFCSYGLSLHRSAWVISGFYDWDRVWAWRQLRKPPDWASLHLFLMLLVHQECLLLCPIPQHSKGAPPRQKEGLGREALLYLLIKINKKKKQAKQNKQKKATTKPSIEPSSCAHASLEAIFSPVCPWKVLRRALRMARNNSSVLCILLLGHSRLPFSASPAAFFMFPLWTSSALVFTLHTGAKFVWLAHTACFGSPRCSSVQVYRCFCWHTERIKM